MSEKPAQSATVEPDDNFEDYDDEWACTHCGGEGWAEVDDPLWDDCDENGIGDCSACGGTGERKHQTVF
jgi:rubredoxin